MMMTVNMTMSDSDDDVNNGTAYDDDNDGSTYDDDDNDGAAYDDNQEDNVDDYHW